MGRTIIKQPLYTIVYLLFVLLVVFPVAYTFLLAFFNIDSLGKNLQLISIETVLLLLKSVLIAATVALFSTFSGTLLGFLLYKTKMKHSSFFKLALLIPLFISPYILAVAWKDFFFIMAGNSNIISSELGVALVLTTIYTPLAMLITGNAFSGIDSKLEESGFMIAGFHRTMSKITLPLIKPAVISSFVLIFIFSISEFSVPAILGVKVFTTEIFTQFSAFYNHSLAILQSALLLIICLLLLFAEGKYIADASFLSVGNRGNNTKTYQLNKRRLPGFLFVIIWLFISVILPFIILFFQTFNNETTNFIRAFKLLLPTFGNSITLATTGALVIVFIGFVAAYKNYLSQTQTKTGKSFDLFMLFLFATPSTIIGISLIRFYNHPALEFIYSGWTIIIIGFVAKFSFIAARLLGNAMKKIPASMDEAAQLEGISKFKRFLRIIVPLVLPSLFATFIISFIFSLGELGITIMVYPPGTEIMPIKVYTIMANAPQSLVSSMTLIVFSVTLLMIIGFYFIAKSIIKKQSYVVG